MKRKGAPLWLCVLLLLLVLVWAGWPQLAAQGINLLMILPVGLLGLYFHRKNGLTDCAVAFCNAVEKRGYRGGVYFNQTQGYRHYDLEQLQDYSLWLAEYGDVPTFRYAFNCLQYSDAGQIDGIPAAVDLDLLFLDEGGDKANADATQGKT